MQSAVFQHLSASVFRFLFLLPAALLNILNILIAGFLTEPTSFAYAANFDEPEQFMAYIESIQSMSTFKSDVEVTEEDKVVSLSTCTYEYNDARYVLVGILK